MLIAHLEADDRHHDRAEALLEDLAAEELGASPLALAELLVAPARAGHVGRATDALERLCVRSVPLPQEAALRLALLRAGTGLSLPVCAVALATETSGAAIASFEGRLCTLAEEGGHEVGPG